MNKSDLLRKPGQAHQHDDLFWFTGWADRIEEYLNKYEPSKWGTMVFRPCPYAYDAMQKFSIRYPQIIEQIKDFLNIANKQYEAFLETPSGDAKDNLCDAMGDLGDRVRTAVKVISEAEGERTKNSKTDNEKIIEAISEQKADNKWYHMIQIKKA